MRRSSARVTFGLLGLAAALRAAPAGTGTPAPQVVSYDAGFARWLNAPRTVEMSQGVTFNQDDASLRTEAAVVVLDDQQRALNAKSQTAVHLSDPQNDLTGAEGFIDFTRHLATLRGNIVLVLKPGAREANAPKSSARRQFTDAATLTCDLMTYDYRQKLGRVPGALTVRQKDRVLTADSGEYDARAQVVTLTGHVHGRNSDGTIRAAFVRMGVAEGAEYITIPGPTTGVFNVPADDAPANASSAPKTSASAPTKSSGSPPPTVSPAP